MEVYYQRKAFGYNQFKSTKIQSFCDFYPGSILIALLAASCVYLSKKGSPFQDCLFFRRQQFLF
jgi:hypothetical protein